MFAFACSLLLPALAAASPDAPELGAEVPSFFVREVTTERPNLATCLVCRYGNRPVVLVCVRKLDSATETLIEAIDRAVDQNRGVGLKGFAIFLAEKPADVQPRLMALVRQRGVTMPLTFPIESDGPKVLRPPPDASVAVLCYSQRRIVAAHVLLPGEIDAAGIEAILSDVRQLTHP